MGENKNLSDRDPVLHCGHRKRMKERFLKSGAESFAVHELIELLLYNTYPRKDTNELAHRLVNEYGGNLVMLMEADPEELMLRCGVNDNTAIFFSIIRELLRRYSDGRFKERMVIDSSKLAGEYASYILSNEKRECFYTICLDAQNRLINSVLIGRGVINQSNVCLRSVVEAVVKYNAVSVLLAHNHPSGSLIPSENDISTTVEIIKILNPMGVRVNDHIIVSDDKFVSFADKGLIINSF